MGVVEQSRKAVESHLSALENSYESFPVNQTTVAVPVEEYRRERERADAGYVDLYAKVENERSEVLHVEDDGDLVLPWARTDEESIERVTRRTVEEATGVDPRLDGIDEATILGIHDASGEFDPVYRLAVVFAGEPASGSTGADAVWRSTANAPEMVAPTGRP